MASSISLGYHQLRESRRHNEATEQEAIRANNLLDQRTRDISDLDRAFNYHKVSVEDKRADKDRASREGIATADRKSRENIATLDRGSREYIADADRRSKQHIAHLDRVQQSAINDAKLQNNLVLSDKQTERELQKIIAEGYSSGNIPQMFGSKSVAQGMAGETPSIIDQGLTYGTALVLNHLLPVGAKVLGSLLPLMI